jgi:hypothetical protein
MDRDGLLRWAPWILGASVVSTIVHYTDNYIDIEHYPQPEWIDRTVVVVAWFAFTAFGALGYVLLRRGALLAAGLSFLVYSYTALSSLGHYRYGEFSDFTARMHLMIWLDGLAGLAVLGLATACLVASGLGRSHAAS